MSKENDRVTSQVHRRMNTCLWFHISVSCALFSLGFFCDKWMSFDEFVSHYQTVSPLWWFDLTKRERERERVMDTVLFDSFVYSSKRKCQFVRLSLCLERAHTSHWIPHFSQYAKERGTLVESSIAQSMSMKMSMNFYHGMSLFFFCVLWMHIVQILWILFYTPIVLKWLIF